MCYLKPIPEEKYPSLLTLGRTRQSETTTMLTQRLASNCATTVDMDNCNSTFYYMNYSPTKDTSLEMNESMKYTGSTTGIEWKWGGGDMWQLNGVNVINCNLNDGGMKMIGLDYGFSLTLFLPAFFMLLAAATLLLLAWLIS